VYGLGAILFYLLTARPPFQAESFESVINQLLNTERYHPSAQSERAARPRNDLRQVPAKGAGKRYATARELAKNSTVSSAANRFMRDP